MFHIMIIHLLLPHLNHTHVQCKVPSFNMLTLIVGTFCLCHLHKIKHSDLFSCSLFIQLHVYGTMEQCLNDLIVWLHLQLKDDEKDDAFVHMLTIMQKKNI
jgi:hypothetical protein